jgi:hypothetical protein
MNALQEKNEKYGNFYEKDGIDSWHLEFRVLNLQSNYGIELSKSKFI